MTNSPRTVAETAIPADVMEAAFKVCNDLDIFANWVNADPIARAIMADRAAREGNEELPRYTTRRLRLEVERVKEAAIMAERQRCVGIVSLWGGVARDLGQRVEATIAADIERHIRTGSPTQETP